ncbi:MAG: hypothetical protein RL701_2722 [Pseudomonadota bacterium]|jgi:hypothetical protein
MQSQRHPAWCVYGLLGCTLLACAQSVARVPSPVQLPATATAALVTNASHPTRCAEEDNVYVKLSGAGLTGMRIEARQPSYISQLKVDDSKADFSDCTFGASDNPVYQFEPKQVVLWETEHWVMLGNTYATFWRPDEVAVVVNGQITRQIHLIQLHLKDRTELTAGRHEFLVLYPPDGYWRAKPIPSLPLTSSNYGTSFLVGPVRDASRPVVELARVEFVPENMTFVLDYRDGSRGEMRVATVNRDKVELEYTHDRALPEQQPLAAIRSMFVTPERSDVAEVSWREARGPAASKRPLPNFASVQASEVGFGRSQVSTHNPSAPDMWFGQFTTVLRPRPGHSGASK